MENKDMLIQTIYRHLTPHLSAKMLRRAFGDKRVRFDGKNKKDISTIAKADLFDKLRQQVFVKQPIGLFMAKRIEGVVYVSYSDLNEKANDVWSFSRAKQIAENRINEMHKARQALEPPYSYIDEKGKEWAFQECWNISLLDRNLDKFVDRCNHYFRDEADKAYPVVCPFRLSRVTFDVEGSSAPLSKETNSANDGYNVLVEEFGC